MAEDDDFADALKTLRIGQNSNNADSRESALLGVLRAGPAPSAEDSTSMLEALLDSCNLLDASNTEQQYAIGAIVCQVQDLLGFGCLPAAAVSRAARLAVDLLGALSSSGSSDESDNETLLAPVPSCAALLCLLSTASDASAALVPEDTLPKALTCALSKVATVAVLREGGPTPLSNTEAAEASRDSVNDDDDDKEVEGERDAAAPAVSAEAAAADDSAGASPMVGPWEQCLEHLCVTAWYQTRVSGRAARLVDAGVAAALAEVVSAVASCGAAKDTVPSTAPNVKSNAAVSAAPIWGLGPCQAACSALLALGTQPPRSFIATTAEDDCTSSSGTSSRQHVANAEILNEHSTNFAPFLSQLPGHAVASAAKMLALVLEKVANSAVVTDSTTVGPICEAPLESQARPLTIEEASTIAASVALPARLLAAGLAHPGGHGQGNDSPGGYGQGGYGQGGRKRESAAVEAAARALDALCCAVLRRRSLVETPAATATAAPATAPTTSIGPVHSEKAENGKETVDALDIAWAGALSKDLLAAVFRGAAVEQSTVNTLRNAVDAADRNVTTFTEGAAAPAPNMASASSISVFSYSNTVAGETPTIDAGVSNSRVGGGAANIDSTTIATLTAEQSTKMDAVARAGLSSLPGAGEGLFAAQAIPAGTFVAFYPGEWRPEHEATSWWDTLPPESAAAAYTAALQDGMLLDGSPAATACAVAAVAVPTIRSTTGFTDEASSPSTSTSDGAAGTEAADSTGVREWLSTRQCLGPLANHPPNGAWPNLVFYEIPAGWFDQANLGNGAGANTMNGGNLLSRLPLTCAGVPSGTPVQASPRAVLVLVTLRACAAGEELFIDYGASANRAVSALSPSERSVDDGSAYNHGPIRGAGVDAAAAKGNQGKDVLPEWCKSPWVGTVAAAHGFGRAWKVTGLPP